MTRINTDVFLSVKSVQSRLKVKIIFALSVEVKASLWFFSLLVSVEMPHNRHAGFGVPDSIRLWADLLYGTLLAGDIK